jgi:hypothetical protein
MEWVFGQLWVVVLPSYTAVSLADGHVYTDERSARAEADARPMVDGMRWQARRIADVLGELQSRLRCQQGEY